MLCSPLYRTISQYKAPRFATEYLIDNGFTEGRCENQRAARTYTMKYIAPPTADETTTTVPTPKTPKSTTTSTTTTTTATPKSKTTTTTAAP